MKTTFVPKRRRFQFTITLLLGLMTVFALLASRPGVVTPLIVFWVLAIVVAIALRPFPSKKKAV